MAFKLSDIMDVGIYTQLDASGLGATYLKSLEPVKGDLVRWEMDDGEHWGIYLYAEDKTPSHHHIHTHDGEVVVFNRELGFESDEFYARGMFNTKWHPEVISRFEECVSQSEIWHRRFSGDDSVW